MLDDIKRKILLSQELSKYIKLKKKGNLHWGCCPFHLEKTPSFAVNDEKSFYYCFGCGASGNIFNFYKNYLDKDFNSALQDLSESYHFKIPKKIRNPELEQILQTSMEKYHENLKENTKAMEYLVKNRNIKEKTIDKFKLGFANGSKIIDFLINKGFSNEDIKRSGIYGFGGTDKFRNRIIFPIFNKKNQVIGFAGRNFLKESEEPKYLNSPETDLFQKNLHIFNENNLISGKPILLVEGYLDVITLYQAGIQNVVASMGTTLSTSQALSLFKTSNRVYFMFDGDEAGQKAIEKNLNEAVKVMNIDNEIIILTLPKAEDPDSFIRKNSIFSLNQVIKSGKNLLNWKWNRFIKIFNKTPNSLAKIFKEIYDFLRNISDPDIKKSYKTFFDRKFLDLKKNLNILPPPEKAISPEEVSIIIIVRIPSIIDDVIEDLMVANFTNKNYEKIKNEIVEKITIDQLSPHEIVVYILSKYNKIIDPLLKTTNFSYIINNRGFALQYIKDSLLSCKANSLE